jgi:hypothetical protein
MRTSENPLHPKDAKTLRGDRSGTLLHWQPHSVGRRASRSPPHPSGPVSLISTGPLRLLVSNFSELPFHALLG